MADTNYNICFLKKFNNYFNRKVIGFSTLADYIAAAEEYFISENPISFDPKDNVSTEIVMNNCPFDADYCILTDLEGNIVSRWFVMEVVFIRRGQKTYQLRRDVIYDNLNELMMSPVFVQKGWLKDSDPFIFNSEGMSFNEMKFKESLLKDKTQSAWIVGYIAKNAAASDISIQKDIKEDVYYITLESIATDLGISITDLSNLIASGGKFTKQVEIRYGWSTNDLIPFVAKQQLFFKGDFSEYNLSSNLVASWTKTLYKLKTVLADSFQTEIDARDAIISSIITNKSSIMSQMSSIFNHTYFTQAQYDKLAKYNGQKVLYNGQVCEMIITASGEDEEVSGPALYSSYSAIGSAIDSAVATSQFTNSATFHSDGEISVRLTNIQVSISLEAYSTHDVSITTKISSTRNKIRDNVFDMFLIPLNTVRLQDNLKTYYTAENIAKEIASEIARELDQECYDIQLLPYFAIPELLNSDNKIRLTNLTEDNDYNFIKSSTAGFSGTITIQGSSMPYVGHGPLPSDRIYGLVYKIFDGYLLTTTGMTFSYTYNNCAPWEGITDGNLEGFVGCRGGIVPNVGYTINDCSVVINYTIPASDILLSLILWAKSNSFSVNLGNKITSIYSAKVESETMKYRLCSPNYQGSFDFNLAKNGMSVEYFIADCTYKPYTPYIKVAPLFRGLYGTNFGDCRGLLCSGDFSLPRVSDAWESYELQNKNYQNIFNREIQNLDFEQSLEYRKALLTGGLGVITGGGAGAVAGGMLGGGWGALGGAVVGSTGSAIGLGIDIDMLVKQQRENKQLAIDKFNYQLGNIKALPYTLTKIGAFNINSKIWPFVEYYTCTDEEREALENKLKYESMTVMRINYFGDFWRVDSQLRYFKGELIRNEEIAEDNHIFEAIYTELAKGVYM